MQLLLHQELNNASMYMTVVRLLLVLHFMPQVHRKLTLCLVTQVISFCLVWRQTQATACLYKRLHAKAWDLPLSDTTRHVC